MKKNKAERDRKFCKRNIFSKVVREGLTGKVKFGGSPEGGEGGAM